jgi:integrase
MEITIYRRHWADCKHKDDRYHPRCGCSLWLQFNWSQPDTKLDGKTLKRGQNKWSAESCIWAQAQRNAKRLESDLEPLLEGKPVRQNVTVKTAVNRWLEFRSKNGLMSTKGKLMGDKLVMWCEKNDVVLLTAITTERAMEFRMSLPFRTGDSSSLSVHWAVIGGFFSWAVGMGYIEKSPSPDTRVFPQFRIKYQQREVVPPTKPEMEKVLATATGRVGILVRLMRESGMALVDAHKFGMSVADGEKYGVSKPERRPIVQDRTLIRGNRTKSNERYRVRISQSLAEQLEALGAPAFPDTYVKWREDVNKVIRQAGVKMTPHGFRHYRITEWLAAGVRVEDVADMVGTSPKEIRKTYRHWIKEAEDRLDEVQRQAWLAQGLEENGNPKAENVQLGENGDQKPNRLQ